MTSDSRELSKGKFKSRPVEIDAIRNLGGMNLSAVMYFLGKDFESFQENEEGETRVTFRNPHKHAEFLVANEGDWIIKGMEGEFYPCVDSVFKKKYERVLP